MKTKFTAKIMCIVLCVMVSMAGVGVCAETEHTAAVYEPTSRVYVRGTVGPEKAGEFVSLMLIKSDAQPNNTNITDIGHIDQTTVKADGSYSFKFIFRGDVDDYSLKIEQAGENITSSVSKAVATSEMLVVNLDLTSNSELAKAVVRIENLYGKESMTYMLALASYDRDGRLIDVNISDAKTIKSYNSIGELTQNLSDDVDTIKAFVWDGTEKMIPLRTAVTQEHNYIKILSIGNSFSQDATRYIYQLANADGIDLKIVNLLIGGCDFETHWAKASGDLADYQLEINGVNQGSEVRVSIKEILESENFDYITMQQVSNKSGQFETFSPYIENFAKYLKTYQPHAELIIHQTWAYNVNSTHSGFANYNNNQVTMFDALVDAYNQAAVLVGGLTLENGMELSKNGQPLRIIPCGKAFQNARATATYQDPNGTIDLCRDGYHASTPYGRYLLSAVWYEALTGRSIANNTYVPTGATTAQLEILKTAAHNAVIEYGWQVAQ